MAELVEQTGLLAKLLGNDQRISPKHIRLAVTNDEGRHFRFVIDHLFKFLCSEFAKLFPGAIFAGSGGGKVGLQHAQAELRGEIVEEGRKKKSSLKRRKTKINKRHKIILVDEDNVSDQDDDDAVTISDVSEDEDFDDFDGVSLSSGDRSNTDLGRYDINILIC